MSTATILDRDFLERLPGNSTLILRDVSWDDYESLLAAVGETAGVRISYDEGTLQIMTLSPKHESYGRLLERLVDRLSVRLGVEIVSFGSSTIRRKGRRKGTEPDACFYVQSAPAIGPRIDLDFDRDPPPDIAVEIDVQHDSLGKFSLYAAMGVPEIWRYDGVALTMHRLEGDHYVLAPASIAFPVLDAQTLTRFLGIAGEKSQHEILLAFEEWLGALPRQ
ncbi:MAG TPA: Uma2 family endonuclease [Vicinamibacteria bacterium]|nr:Uma2 family endonuclease [Vicinamibacteria bacterium]